MCRSITSQRREAWTGILDYGPRMYDSTLGRFLQADSIVPSALDSQALDRYAYARNNPVRFTDPTGHSFLSSLLGGLAGGFVTAITAPYLGPASPILGGMVGGAVAGGFSAWENGGGFEGIYAGATIGMVMGGFGAAIGVSLPAPLAGFIGSASMGVAIASGKGWDVLGGGLGSAIGFGVGSMFRTKIEEDKWRLAVESTDAKVRDAYSREMATRLGYP